jgi:hypothetical protein
METDRKPAYVIKNMTTMQNYDFLPENVKADRIITLVSFLQTATYHKLYLGREGVDIDPSSIIEFY